MLVNVSECVRVLAFVCTCMFVYTCDLCVRVRICTCKCVRACVFARLCVCVCVFL
jgi:hypothetical protein